MASAIGIVQSTVSAMERGQGASLSVDVWQHAFTFLDRYLTFDLGRDRLETTADAGHLAMQELVLKLGRASGYQATFELPTRPMDPARSSDVGLRDERRRVLALIECWNAIGDIGTAARSTDRKLAEAAQLAAATLGEQPHRVAGCWVIRATKRNRELVARYPEVVAARFQGSSIGWIRAITEGALPPADQGLIWSDVPATGLFAWRRR